MAASQNTLLTVREVAEILKVPVSWVYEHTRINCIQPLPHLKIGKYLRFSEADILSYVRASRSDKPRLSQSQSVYPTISSFKRQKKKFAPSNEGRREPTRQLVQKTSS